MRPRLPHFVLLACILTVGACSDEATSAALDVEVSDSAGIPVRTFAHTPGDLPSWAIEPTPVLDIGSISGEGPTAFARVGSVALTADAGVIVADELVGEIRTFGPDGSHLRTVGGSGEGPGEFSNSIRLTRVAGDSVYAWDGRTRRLSLFVGDTFVEGWTPVNGAAVTNPTMVGDQLYGETTLNLTGIPESGMNRPNAQFGRVQADGSHEILLDTSGHERYLDIETSGGSIVSIAVFQTAFARGAFFTALPTDSTDRLLGGPNDRYVVHEWTADGQLSAVHRFPGLDDPVTDADIERARQRIMDRFDEPSERMRVELETLVGTAPEFTPAWDRIWEDDEDRLWMRHSLRDRVEEWFVFSVDDLSPLGRLTLPEGFTLMDVRDGRLAGRWLDDLDVGYVRVYRLADD